MDFAKKRVVVMGLGRFGGGIGVTRFLALRAAEVVVTDLLPPEKLAQSVSQLRDLPVRFRLGEHVEEDFTQADLVVVNPAVDQRKNRFLQAARGAGVATTSEIRLLVDHLPCRERVIGITGTAGKSTTTAMIGHILKKTAPGVKTWVGGNLGGSLLGELDQIRPEDWVALELSSFMLEDMAAAGGRGGWSPHIAVVTNVQPNHLDRHDTFAAYAQAKQQILEHQGINDIAVLGPGLPEMIQPRHHRVIRAPEDGKIGGQINLLLPGSHNQLNAWMAIEACMGAGISPGRGAAALADFGGLPHRLQYVGEARGVKYFNDSKATTPQAAMLGLSAFEPGKAHIILGGYDKHSDLTEMAQMAARHARAVYTIGATGSLIATMALATNPDAHVHECETLDQAVALIRNQAQPGEVGLLSPGCASWDQFENYEIRGELFERLAKG